MVLFWEGLSLMPPPPTIHSSTSFLFFFSIPLQRFFLSRLTYACRELSLPWLWISVKSFSSLSCAVLHCERCLAPFSWKPWAELICMTLCSQWHYTVSVGDRQVWLRACLISKDIFPRGNGYWAQLWVCQQKRPGRHSGQLKHTSAKEGRWGTQARSVDACQATSWAGNPDSPIPASLLQPSWSPAGLTSQLFVGITRKHKGHKVYIHQFLICVIVCLRALLVFTYQMFAV